MESLRINPQRLRNDFEALAQIGSTGNGGVHRPTFSEAHLAARNWFGERIRAAGLELRTDGAGNHSAFLKCGRTGTKTLLLGSHLDSVPYGGRFDGALGVLVALEVLRTVKDAGLSLAYNLEAIDFTDEEGTLIGLLGSCAMAGKLTPEDLRNPRGGWEALLEGLNRAGLGVEGLLEAKREPESLAGYLELHVEQGPQLEKAGVDIGVVTGITGLASYMLTFTGRSDHAGTTPLPDRLDAGLGACSFTVAARRLALEDFPGCVFNIGKMSFYPGAFNIVPEKATLSLEVRAAERETFKRLESSLLALARAEAKQLGLTLEVEFMGRHDPTPMSIGMQAAIERAAEWLGLKHMPLTSGAGHDAQSIHALCPTGMLFVPSKDGRSHSPRELTHWKDCVNGANVLLQATLYLGRKSE